MNHLTDKPVISLAPWIIEDTEWLTLNFNDLNIWNNLRDSVPFPYTQEHAGHFITLQQTLSPAQNFKILLDEQAVGGIGIELHPDVYRMNVSLSYWIIPNFWGQGIATEAIRLMTSYVFEHFAINRIVAEVFEYNKASMRVLEKNGYTLQHVARKEILKGDWLYDNYYWVCQKVY